MYKVSHFTFFKPFDDEFELVRWAAEGSYMVQYLLRDGVENLKKKTAVPSEGLRHCTKTMKVSLCLSQWSFTIKLQNQSR